jgi:rhomboid family GlyGly-CTERM serine protease
MGLDDLHKAARFHRHWYGALGLAILATLLQLGGDGARELLAFERDGLAAGEVWRLLGGHFVHLGWSHLLLNLVGLALVAWLVGYAFDGLRWLFVMVLSIAAIDAGLWFLDTGLDWYVGLSGLLHGLLAAGLFVGLVRRDREALILALFVLAKLGWEQLVGPLPGSESTAGGAVIVNAHLYGAAGGALAALLCRRSARGAAPL